MRRGRTTGACLIQVKINQDTLPDVFGSSAKSSQLI